MNNTAGQHCISNVTQIELSYRMELALRYTELRVAMILWILIQLNWESELR